MNVILHPSRCEDMNVEFFADTPYVSPHSGPELACHKPAAIFGAEHNMNYVFGVCVRQVSHLRRLGSSEIRTQPLRAGLISGTPPPFVESESAYLRVRIVYHIINY